MSDGMDSGDAAVAEVIPSDGGALAALHRANLITQVDIAKRYPRSLDTFRKKALTLATANAEIAASMFFKLKRKGEDGGAKVIEGPSIRLAEVVASAWGNVQYAGRIIGDDGRFLIAQAVAHDLESNVSSTVEVRRRITGRNGRRYSDDMIAVTANAAIAIAIRNAINKTVPLAYTLAIMDEAKKVAVGNAKSLDERRSKMITAFAAHGITSAQLCAKVGKTGPADIGLAEVEDLLGVFTALRDGESTVDEEFPPTTTSSPAPTMRQQVNAGLASLRAINATRAAEIAALLPKMTDDDLGVALAEITTALAAPKPAEGAKA